MCWSIQYYFNLVHHPTPEKQIFLKKNIPRWDSNQGPWPWFQTTCIYSISRNTMIDEQMKQQFCGLQFFCCFLGQRLEVLWKGDVSPFREIRILKKSSPLRETGFALLNFQGTVCHTDALPAELFRLDFLTFLLFKFISVSFLISNESVGRSTIYLFISQKEKLIGLRYILHLSICFCGVFSCL